MDRSFITLDTETTGLDRAVKKELYEPMAITGRGSEVIQLGGIIANEEMIPQRLFCYYCDTVVADSPSAAYKVHGISQKEVREHLMGVYPSQIIHENLREFLGKDAIFIGYNVEFDLDMLAQSMANSPGSFSWNTYKGSFIPKSGRYAIDVAEMVKHSKHYYKLSYFEDELAPLRNDFFEKYGSTLKVETNCREMLEREWDKAHNSFYDALNTFLLWGDRVWRTKMF